MASVFNSVISSLLEVHTPVKRRKITSHHAPWITVEIENLMKERDLAKKRSEKDAVRGCGTKSLLNFVPGYRNTIITLLTKPKTSQLHTVVSIPTEVKDILPSRSYAKQTAVPDVVKILAP